MKHVKENDLAHGEWSKWLKSVNFNDSQARKFIKVFYEAQQEFSDYNNGGLFEKWYSSLGFKKRNVYNYIQIYNEVQQLHGDQLETFEELPKFSVKMKPTRVGI